MATKKEIVGAQGFSRGRLLTAFISGAPGGKEPAPSKPMGAVVGGVVLAVLMVVGIFVFGLISPGLPKGWDNNTLVITKDEGAGGSRYLASHGTLYPVKNLTSARLLVPAGSFKVILVGQDKLASADPGKLIGIAGAPDAPPSRDRLVSTGWMDCTSPTGAMVTVLSKSGVGAKVAAAKEPKADAAGPGLLVSAAGDQFLVAGGRRYHIPPERSVAVLREVGQDAESAWKVNGRWLNLFPAGSDLAPIEVDGAGSAVPDGVKVPKGASVGSVLAVKGTDRRYVIDAHGELAALSDFAVQMYALGKGARSAPIDVTATQIASMQMSSADVAPADWPTVKPSAVPDGGAACAVLSTGAAGAQRPVRLAFSTSVKPKDGSGSKAEVEPSGGALVRAGATGKVHLIDDSGTAFPIPKASTEILGRLGFTAKDVTVVPTAWLNLFRVGPELTQDGATANLEGF